MSEEYSLKCHRYFLAFTEESEEMNLPSIFATLPQTAPNKDKLFHSTFEFINTKVSTSHALILSIYCGIEKWTRDLVLGTLGDYIKQEL